MLYVEGLYETMKTTQQTLLHNQKPTVRYRDVVHTPGTAFLTGDAEMLFIHGENPLRATKIVPECYCPVQVETKVLGEDARLFADMEGWVVRLVASVFPLL